MIPNLFTKIDIPSSVPTELELKIKEISKLRDKEAILHESFFYIVNNWGGSRFNLCFKFFRLFETSLDKILKTKGYLHCNTMNYLLRVILVKTGIFSEEDIKIKLTNTWYIGPHQYLEVRISETQKINLDPWCYQFGIDFGEFGSGFDSIKMTPVR